MNLEEIKAATGEITLWDDKIKGLHLRVFPGGKVFYLRYRTRWGQQRRFSLGRFGQITLYEARDRARGILDKVAIGEDPKGEWKERQEALTVSEAFQKAYDAHWSSPRFERSGWAKQVRQMFDREVGPAFGHHRLADLKAVEIRAWHGKRAEVPYRANRSLEVLSKVFSYAEEQELIPQGLNPCRLVKQHPESKRRRYASEIEIQRIAPLLEKYAPENPEGVAFLYLLIFSGSRPRAIERATKDQLTEFMIGTELYGVLQFQGKSSIKTGQDEKVILPPQAMRALGRLADVPRDTLTGITFPRRLWNKIRKEAGCEDLWARDWRRTFATVGMSGGVKMDVIGELLNHQSTQTTKIYAKLMETERVAAVGQIAGRMQSLLQIPMQMNHHDEKQKRKSGNESVDYQVQGLS